jgi:hypothetical protein
VDTCAEAGPELIAFLTAEGDRLEKAATAEAAAARTKRRKFMDAARSIVSALQAAGLPVSPELQRAAPGRSISQDESISAVNAGMAALQVERRSASAANEQAARATRLAADQVSQSIAELGTHLKRESTPTERRLDALLAELEVLADAAPALTQRADAIAAERDGMRQRLLLDSLVQDASAQVAQVHKRAGIDAKLQQAVASLEEVADPKAQTLRDTIRTSIDQIDDAGAARLQAEVVEVIDAHIRDVASVARRKAVLSGLSALVDRT